MTHEPLKVNTVHCFESSVVINPVTQRKNPEDPNPLLLTLISIGSPQTHPVLTHPRVSSSKTHVTGFVNIIPLCCYFQ